MNERKVGMALLIIVGLFWWMAPAVKPDPTQCDIPTDSSALIEQVASVNDSLTVQPDLVPKATEMVDPKPSPSDKPHKKTKREVLIFVSKNCPPCERWKRCEMQKFLDAGWSVGIVEVHSYGLTPTFEIESGDEKVTIKGYTTLEQALEAVR
jgi:hypothetical protein